MRKPIEIDVEKKLHNKSRRHLPVSIAHSEPYYLLKYKIVHVSSNLSCLNRYLTPRFEPYLIYHRKPISQVSRNVGSDVANINQFRRGADLAVILALEIVSLDYTLHDFHHKLPLV